jgi:nicotinamidase-related amidase
MPPFGEAFLLSGMPETLVSSIAKLTNMTTLTNRPNTALLIIDVQNGVVESAHKRDSVIANINVALDKARSAGVPVIWVQHSDSEMPIGSDAWQIVRELVPVTGEERVEKTFRSSFVGTNLEELLAAAQVGQLVICGAETNNCVRHTSHAALEAGYDITLLADAHTTNGYTWNGHTIDPQNVIDEQNDNLGHYDLPGRVSRAVSAADLAF